MECRYSMIGNGSESYRCTLVQNAFAFFFIFR